MQMFTKNPIVVYLVGDSGARNPDHEDYEFCSIINSHRDTAKEVIWNTDNITLY